MPYSNPNSNYTKTADYQQSIFSNLGMSDLAYNSSSNEYTADLWVDSPPVIPANFDGIWYSNHPKITWSANTEPDFDNYIVYMKSVSVDWHQITTTTNTYYIDYGQSQYLGRPNIKTNIYYKIKAADTSGNTSDYTNDERFAVNAPLFKKSLDGADNNFPADYRVGKSFPNPFNPMTTIAYDIPIRSEVKVIVFDITGRPVYQEYYEKPAGFYSLAWRGNNNSGQQMPSGIYLVRFEVTGVEAREGYSGKSGLQVTQKIILMK